MSLNFRDWRRNKIYEHHKFKMLFFLTFAFFRLFLIMFNQPISVYRIIIKSHIVKQTLRPLSNIKNGRPTLHVKTG